jgi:hypothetical protein
MSRFNKRLLWYLFAHWQANILIMKWTIMMLKLDVIQNGSALNLHFFNTQEFPASDIYRLLIAIFDSDVITYSTVTKYLRETQYTADNEMTTKLEGLMLLIE